MVQNSRVPHCFPIREGKCEPTDPRSNAILLTSAFGALDRIDIFKRQGGNRPQMCIFPPFKCTTAIGVAWPVHGTSHISVSHCHSGIHGWYTVLDIFSYRFISTTWVQVPCSSVLSVRWQHIVPVQWQEGLIHTSWKWVTYSIGYNNTVILLRNLNYWTIILLTLLRFIYVTQL